MRKATISIAVAAALASSIAAAEETGPYALISAGASDADNALTAEIGVGWRLTEKLAAEIQITRYGQTTGRVPSEYCYSVEVSPGVYELECVPTTVVNHINITGAALVGRLDLWKVGSWTVRGSAGAYISGVNSALVGASIGRGAWELEYRYLPKVETPTGDTDLNALVISWRFR